MYNSKDFNEVEMFDQDSQIGKRFENEIVFYLSKLFGKDFSAQVGTEKDTNEGVDALVYGAPVDFTVNPEKDFCDELTQEFKLMTGVLVRFGIRTGNSHNGFTRFQNPVLVIRVDAGKNLYRWFDNIVEEFTRQFSEIIDLGQSQYWDWIDAHEDEYQLA